MKNPDTIYMQHDCDGDLSTWCADRVNDSDTVYVQAKALKTARDDEREKCVSELIALTNQIYQEYQGHTWVDKATAQDNDHSSTSVQFALRRAIACIKG